MFQQKKKKNSKKIQKKIQLFKKIHKKIKFFIFLKY